MKNHRENALRWLDQGKHDLESAKNNLENVKFYSDACFMSEQASQKALKAYLLFKGERYVLSHSVKELAESCAEYDKEFTGVVECGMILDKYYIPTRYPDALAPPAVPYKSYIEKEAVEAVGYAKKIINLASKKIVGRIKKEG